MQDKQIISSVNLNNVKKIVYYSVNYQIIKFFRGFIDNNYLQLPLKRGIQKTGF